jgi:hypothetical protein
VVEIGMAQQQLHHAQVGAMVEQVGGEGMAQRAATAHRDAGLQRVP